MKNSVKILVALIVLMSVIVGGCKKENLENSIIIEKIVVNKAIGEEHNKGLDDFLDAFNRDKKESITNSQKIAYVKEYFDEEFDVDISPIVNAEIENLNNDDVNSLPIFENIDIEGLVNDASRGFSDYFRLQLNNILIVMKDAKNDTTQMKQMINEYLLKANDDDNFAVNEKEYFINMLYVYDSLISYWYNDNNYKNGMKKPEPDDMWKIPVSDWIGGIFGSIGGPAGGVAGYLASSALAAVGIW